MQENERATMEYSQEETTGEQQEAAPATPEEKRAELRRRAQEEIRQTREALEVMKEGKGRLGLETPITAGDKEFTELAYDFTKLSGLEYTDAMDSDRNINARQIDGISSRQGLELFARAAAKEAEELDATDIVTRMGGTDAPVAVQLASLFFAASRRAGLKRIWKK